MSSSAEPNPLERSVLQRRMDWHLNSETRDRVQAGVRLFGEDAFTAFLIVPGIDLHHPDLLDEFEQRYAGSFNTVRDVCDRWLRSASWQVGLAEYTTISSDEPGRLAINYEAVERDIRMAFEIVKLGEGVHVFVRTQ